MCGVTSQMFIGSVVLAMTVIWWLNSRLDEILKEVKKK